MKAQFQRQQPYGIDKVNESIKADYLFTFLPTIFPPVPFHVPITIAIPDPGFGSLEEAIESVLFNAATEKLEELEKALPGYLF